jgi:uncharacterized protein
VRKRELIPVPYMQWRSTRVWRYSGILLCLVLLGLARVAYRHYRDVIEDFEPAAATELSKHPDRAGIAELEEVSFQSGDGLRLAGWYVPSHNRAAIVVTHGTSADRASMVGETRVLAQAGFGVLAFDWPGDGASGGSVHWDVTERRALGAAIDWLARRPDVDRTRLGGLGFSMGGYVMAQVAARDSRLRAVILLSAPSDYAQLTYWQQRRWGFLSEVPAGLALRNSGMPVTELRPIDVVHDISPRPLFVIGGDADKTVPPFMTRALYEAARNPKFLWTVPGAGHGGYARAAGDEYGSRLVRFFTDTLIRSNDSRTESGGIAAAGGIAPTVLGDQFRH